MRFEHQGRGTYGAQIPLVSGRPSSRSAREWANRFAPVALLGSPNLNLVGTRTRRASAHSFMRLCVRAERVIGIWEAIEATKPPAEIPDSTPCDVSPQRSCEGLAASQPAVVGGASPSIAQPDRSTVAGGGSRQPRRIHRPRAPGSMGHLGARKQRLVGRWSLARFDRLLVQSRVAHAKRAWTMHA